MNFTKGKPEVITMFRGQGSAKVKSILHDSVASAPESSKGCMNIPTVTSDNKTIHLVAVSHYKHLGSIISDNMSYVPEALKRSRSAMATYAKLSMHILGDRSTSLKRRMMLAWSLIFSKPLYNIHNWTSFGSRAREVINSAYMKVWRKVSGFCRYDAKPVSYVYMRTFLGVPSTDNVVRCGKTT